MLANFFSKSKPVNFIIIIVLFLIYYVLNTFIYRSTARNFEMLLVLPLYLGVFFLFNFIISKNRLTKEDSYAFLLFVVGLGCLPLLNVSYVVLIKYILLFLFFRRIYSLRTPGLVYEKLFDSGFWLGVLFLESSEYVLYLFLLFAALLLFVKVTFRTLVIPIVGFLTPLFLFFTYHFYVDTLDDFYQLFDIGFTLDFNNYNSSFYGVYFSVFGLITFIAVLLRSSSLFFVSNRFKKRWSLLLLHLLTALGSLFLVEVKDGTELIAVLIPSTMVIANWIQSVERKIIINIVLLLFLATSFAVHFIV
jgi:hypothetical protein